jgi:DNA replication protein DnaC
MHSIGDVLARKENTREPAEPEWVGEHYQEMARKLDENEQGAGSVCEACDGLGWIKSNIVDPQAPGFGQFIPCEACGVVAAQRLKKLEEISGLTDAERQLSLANFIGRAQDTPKMIEVIRQYADSPCGFLTLWGGPGNGKTLGLMALANHFRNQGKLSVYVTFVDLLDYIRAGFANDADENARDRYEMMKRAYFLAVDEVDKANITAFADEFRTRFLDDRYRLGIERQVHTAFAMNHSPEFVFADAIHIISRLRDGRFIFFNNSDQDMRPALGGGR